MFLNPFLLAIGRAVIYNCDISWSYKHLLKARHSGGGVGPAQAAQDIRG